MLDQITYKAIELLVLYLIMNYDYQLLDFDYLNFFSNAQILS